MTVRAFVMTAVVLSCAAVPIVAQQTAPTPRPAPAAQTPRAEPAQAPAPARREPPGQAVNIKVELTITDQRGTAAALKKMVTVVTADQRMGFIRTQASIPQIGDVPLNVDAEPQLLTDGKIRLRLNLQYDLPAVAPEPGHPVRTAIRENLALILENGKALVAAQSADPVSDRQVTVEVKATVLK